MTKHLVKRSGSEEPFDSRKVYGSVYAACSALRMTQAEVELIADRAAKATEVWIAKYDHVTSDQIAKVVVREIKKFNRDAAYLYEHHTDVS